MDMASDMSRSSTWKVKVVIFVLFMIFLFVLYNLVAEAMSGHEWLRVQCNVNMITEFNEDVESVNDTRSLAGTVISIDMVSQSTMQYCSGYRIESGDKLYFLCSDGRLYELTSCRDVEQEGSRLFPMIPDPDTLYGD